MNRKKALIVSDILLIGFLLCCIGIWETFDNASYATMFAAFAITQLIALAILTLRTIRCPHCGTYLPRVNGDTCPSCGGELNAPPPA